ncbi:hypothetical protein CYLTODRAFT_486479 [Cylindrobasidium torrendii FP15055 ss-10]|uniref:Uncharacterized protein n=1 Tax=Cylindrobasidium torrendii FP15055 ss-10 TaxID=1314674 RepID=A0A0D7BP00_9AGAR|nr:hypothetical protein CYLTODRAFT_486479 [Cylindrobasidium torrendii FP15055 ss-10]
MAVVVLPPPTTNWLTAHERSKLRRKTRKLGQLLGYMPHIVDEDRITHTYEPKRLHELDLSRSAPSSRPSTAGSTYSGSSTKLSSTHRTAYLSTWSHKRRTLSYDDRLSVGPPLLQVHHPDANRLSCLSTTSTEEEKVVPAGPVNANTMRRQKMDKLRRVLGDDVPPKLVFKRSRYATVGIQVDDLESDVSDSDLDSESAVSPTSSLETYVDSDVEEEKELPPVPRATSPRDSLLVPTAHKARRTSSIKRKPVPKMELPPPPTPQMDIDELERAVDADIRRLFDIIEEECKALRNGGTH